MKFKTFLFASVFSAMASLAAAQDFPSKPITIISPFPPGGGTDTLARLVAGGMTEKMGWKTIVENKPGAGGNLALDSTARANTDGYTLVLAQTDNIVLNPWLYEKLPYDTFKDFTPVGLVASSPSVFVVAPDSPYKTLADVAAAAAKNPGKLTLGIPGAGGTGDLLGHLWRSTGKVHLTHIPYRGWALAYTDLISQRIDLYTGSVASLLPQILSGKVRALGVVATERSPVLPDVPTFVESGFKELNQSIWWGLAAPGKTRAATVAKLNEGLLKALADPEVAKKLRASGYNIIASTPEEMAKRYKADYELFGKIIKDAGIKAAQD
ncbi:MAG: tripartite tricarboxylate transporter substrate binding protein [Sheuella sp.]|nr:tripartite tricarboxylate transporter substrate binding protein [Sheuella sp.]